MDMIQTNTKREFGLRLRFHADAFLPPFFFKPMPIAFFMRHIANRQMNTVFGVISNLKIIFLLFSVLSKISNIQTHTKYLFGYWVYISCLCFTPSFFFFFFKKHVSDFSSECTGLTNLFLSPKLLLKMNLITLFTHLKIILLQCFHFQFSTK